MSATPHLEIPQDILDSARMTVDQVRIELATHLYAQGRLSIAAKLKPLLWPSS